MKVSAGLPQHGVPGCLGTARTGNGNEFVVNRIHPASLVHLIGLYGRTLAERLGPLDYKIEKQLFISTKSFQD